MNPLRAVGYVYRWKPEVDPAKAYLGTCFAFRDSSHFITARHCVEGLLDDEVGVQKPSGLLIGGGGVAIHRHASADIAVLETPGMEIAGAETEPFTDVAPTQALGEDFWAFGYPVDVLGRKQEPTPRLLKGHFQRFLEFRSFSGAKYAATELSIPVPAGLSGGPLFRPQARHVVMAMATENLESTTFVESVEEVVDGGNVRTTRLTKIITYGIALMLSDVMPWLNELVPPPKPASAPTSEPA